MNSNLDRALDDFSIVILDFYLNSFTIKEIVPPKAQYILASVQDMDVKFDIIIRQKTIFSCLLAVHTCSEFSPYYFYCWSRLTHVTDKVRYYLKYHI